MPLPNKTKKFMQDYYKRQSDRQQKITTQVENAKTRWSKKLNQQREEDK